MNKKLKELEELDEALKMQAEKHYTILEYLLNKNSHPSPRCVDHEKLFEDLQDYEDYLREQF